MKGKLLQLTLSLCFTAASCNFKESEGREPRFLQQGSVRSQAKLTQTVLTSDYCCLCILSCLVLQLACSHFILITNSVLTLEASQL